MKKRFGALGAFALTVATALSLTACGGHIGEPAEITPSEAFNQKGLWFNVFAYEGSLGKDSELLEVWDFDGNGNVTVIPTSEVTLGDLKDLSDEEILEKVKQKLLNDQQKKKINEQDQLKGINESRAGTHRYFKVLYDKPMSMTNFELYDTLHLSPVKFDLHVKTNQSGNEAKLEKMTASYSYPAWPFVTDGPGFPEYDENKNRMSSGEITLKEKSINIEMKTPESAVVYDKKYVGFADGRNKHFLKAAKSLDSKTVCKLDTPDTKGIKVD